MERYDIKGYPGYTIDKMGNVYSEDRVVKRGKGTYTIKGRKLKPVEVSTYLCVYLYVPGHGMKRRYVASLMRDTFMGKAPKGKPEIGHKDCDRHNNALTNLQYESRSENVKHSYDVCRKKNKSV